MLWEVVDELSVEDPNDNDKIGLRGLVLICLM